MSHKKKLRNEALREYWQAHRENDNYKSYSQIGKIFLQPNGKPLSKQRVFQIIQANQNKTKEV